MSGICYCCSVCNEIKTKDEMYKLDSVQTTRVNNISYFIGVCNRCMLENVHDMIAYMDNQCRKINELTDSVMVNKPRDTDVSNE